MEKEKLIMGCSRYFSIAALLYSLFHKRIERKGQHSRRVPLIYLKEKKGMESTVYTLIPPLLAILMVAVTRKVLLSLGAGIVASALMLTDFNISNTCILIWDAGKRNLYQMDH